MNSFFRNLGLGLAALSWLVTAASTAKHSELSWLEGTWKCVQDPLDQWTWSSTDRTNWTGLHQGPKGEIQVLSITGQEGQMLCWDNTGRQHRLQIRHLPQGLCLQCPHAKLELKYYQGRSYRPELVIQGSWGVRTYRKT